MIGLEKKGRNQHTKIFASFEHCASTSSRVNNIYHLRVFFFSGGDNGSLTFWDYNTGTPFQHLDDIPQPGSLEADAGVFCSTFDVTGTRLITGGADKTIMVPGVIP
jgi:WD40 repeat protein